MESLLVVITAVFVLGGLTLVLATLLVVANRKLSVDEDPRLEAVAAMLPKNNCGGCGYPSCAAFAEALVKGEVSPSGCTVSSESQQARIAAFLSVDVGSHAKHVARLACAGGSNVAVNKAHYYGEASCLAASQVGGGPKSCGWGCLGFGDCAKVCTFDAISMDAHGLPKVDENKCTACGDCVGVCPKDLFSLQSIDNNLWVACKSEEAGDTVLASCQVGCTACGRCAMDAPDGQIVMQNNLPRVDYKGINDKKHSGREAIERCPTGAIVWIEQGGAVAHGREAKNIVRQSSLPEITS